MYDLVSDARGTSNSRCARVAFWGRLWKVRKVGMYRCGFCAACVGSGSGSGQRTADSGQGQWAAGTGLEGSGQWTVCGTVD
jgi:hypothetical protein